MKRTRHVMTVLYAQPDRHIPALSHLKACAEAGAFDEISVYSNTPKVVPEDARARRNFRAACALADVEVAWYDSPMNVGKACGMNHIMDQAGENEIWFHMDSDILIQPDTMAQAFKLFEEHGNKKFHILSLEQSQARCHNARFSKPPELLMQHHTVYYSNTGRGIAGGAMLLASHCKARYKEGHSVYGGNEPSMYGAVRSVYGIDKFTVGLTNTLVVVHPHDKDTDYTNWKRKTHQLLKCGKRGPKTGYFENAKEESQES